MAYYFAMQFPYRCFFFRSWLAISGRSDPGRYGPWLAADKSAEPYFAYSMLALLAFGLDLADGSTMGFVFIILALPHLGWRETLLLAESADVHPRCDASSAGGAARPSSAPCAPSRSAVVATQFTFSFVGVGGDSRSRSD